MKQTKWIGALLALAVLAGCGKDDSSSSGGSGGSASSQKTPEEAFKEFKAAGEAGDAKALWNSMSKKSHAKIATEMQKMIDQINKKGDQEWEEAAKELGKPAAELKKMTPEEFGQLFVAMKMTTPEEKEKAKKLVLDKVEMRGEIAVLFTTKANGKKDLVALVKEDGTWKADLEEEEKLADEVEKLNK